MGWDLASPPPPPAFYGFTFHKDKNKRSTLAVYFMGRHIHVFLIRPGISFCGVGWMGGL